MRPPGWPFHQVRPGFLAALLLAWFWGQVISVSPRLGLTVDEGIHLAAGYEYWRHGDYRLQPENGNLPQRLAALPLLWLQPRPVPADHPALARADTWGVAHEFLFNLGNRPELMLFLGRVMIALLGVATGALVYAWARDLWGAPGGLVATGLFSTSPTVLAHAGLATSDLAATCGFLAALLTGWRLLHAVTPGRTAAFGAALGGLALSKFSAPLLVFVFAGMLGLRLLRRTPLVIRIGSRRWRAHRWARLAVLAPAVAVSVLLAVAAIWAAYGFRFAPSREARPVAYAIRWELILGQMPYTLQLPVPAGLPAAASEKVEPTFVRRTVQWARDHRLLPDAYLFGFTHVYTFARNRPGYFLGESGNGGRPAFFPVSVLLKTPLTLLALGTLALTLLARLHRHEPRAGRLWYRLAPLLIFLGVYGAFAVGGSLNLGIRHLLPTEGAAAIVGGVIGCAIRQRPRVLGPTVVLLFVATNAATWMVRPSYLAFFNRLAGGPAEGYRYLVDSSVDWGQGLPALADWLAEHGRGQRVYLSYFGSDSPRYAGLRVLRTGDGFFGRDPGSVPLQLRPGLYAVSATLLQGVYTLSPGPWTAAHEQAYQDRLPRALGPERLQLGGDFWFEWDQLRFGRLRHFLRRRPPDAQPDPSILVYRLGDTELVQALGHPVPPVKDP